MNDEGLADAAAANPFVYPDFTQELVRGRPTLLRPPRRDRCRPDRIFPVLSERACVGSGRRHLGRGPVSDEPRAPNPAKHSRVQDASKRLDRDQVRSREPGNGDHVYPPVQTVPARGGRQCSADVPVYRGITGLTQRLAGELVQQRNEPTGVPGVISESRRSRSDSRDSSESSGRICTWSQPNTRPSKCRRP